MRATPQGQRHAQAIRRQKQRELVEAVWLVLLPIALLVAGLWLLTVIS